MQAKQIGFYSTEQSQISIDYINQKLPSVPIKYFTINNTSI